eukprot:10127630-Alexandrium_andersonii.AAC.1
MEGGRQAAEGGRQAAARIQKARQQRPPQSGSQPDEGSQSAKRTRRGRSGEWREPARTSAPRNDEVRPPPACTVGATPPPAPSPEDVQ